MLNHLRNFLDDGRREFDERADDPRQDQEQDGDDRQGFGDKRQGLLVDGRDRLKQAHGQADDHGGDKERRRERERLEHHVLQQFNGKFRSHAKTGAGSHAEAAHQGLHNEGPPVHQHKQQEFQRERNGHWRHHHHPHTHQHGGHNEVDENEWHEQ